jgi:uncharacterized repeat protein (TIGR01451 family)
VLLRLPALLSSLLAVLRAIILFGLLLPASLMAADLQVSGYSWLPDPVPNGAATQFSIRVTNNGPGSVGDAVVTIAISDRFRVDAGDHPSYCVLAGAVGAQTLTCNLPPLATGDQVFTFAATAIAVGSANTTALVSSATAADPNGANDSLTVTPAVQNGADLTVTKDDGLPGNAIVAGGTISYQLIVNNAGPDATSAIQLTDNLPAATDFDYQAASGTNWNCAHSSPTVTCSYTGPAVTGPLPPVTVTGRVIRASSGTITNNAFASLTNPGVLDPDGSNNAAAPVITAILEGSDLRADKTMPATIVVGSNAVISLRIFNDGPQAVAGATISDTIANSFTIGALPSDCSMVGQTVTCNAGALASGDSRTFAVPVVADTITASPETNSASIGLPPGLADPVIANNSDTASYKIVAPTADLSLSKSKTPDPVAAGGDMTSTIVVRNNGPAALSYSPASPIRVADTVSADETYVSANAAWSCAQAGNVITCDTTGTGTLSLNGTVTLTLVTRAGAAANSNLVNTACTGSTGGSQATPADPADDSNDCNGAGVRATTVTTDLAVMKEVALSAAGPWSQAPALTVPASADSFFIRLRASNVGGAAAGSVTVTDTLPNALNAGSFVTGFAQISASSGNTAYSSSSGRISWSLTNLGAGATETAIVRIDRPVNSGTFTNIAEITSSDTIDSNNANDSSQAGYTVVPVADIAVSGKSISPNPARVGVLSTYTISLVNNGANPADNVIVTDTIDPARFELVGNPASTKGGSSCSKDDASGEISCDMGQFTRGQSFQITQQVRPRFPFGGATSGFPINHTNTASATTTTPESDAANNSFSVTHAVTAPGFDLAVTKQEPDASFDPRRFGDELVYDIRVSNFGPSRASNLVITDIPQPPAGYTMTLAGFSVNPVPASSGFTLYNPPAPACLPVSGNIECRLHGSSPAANYLDALNQVVFRLRFTPGGTPPTGSLTFTNEAQIIALEQDNVAVNQADTQLANNKAVQTTTVLPSADLEAVSKARVSASPASINEPVDYDIVIRNNGISPITQVRVTDALPAGFALAAAPTATAAGTASVSAINCTGSTSVLCVLDGTFPPDGSQVTIRLRARAAHPYAGPLLSDMTNMATITPGLDAGGQELARDGDSTNNSKTAAVQIAQSSIAGTVFADANLDNIVQGGEGLAGTTVVLSGTDAFGNVIAPITRTTGAGGTFLFDRLPAGTYQIVETQPSGLFDVNETAGTAGGTVNNAAYGSAAVTNSITAVSLPTNTAATGYLFQEAGAGVIEGTVWSDANNNGAIDAGEPGIPPASVPSTPQLRLTGTDRWGGDVNLTATVDANGNYRFADLPPSDATGYTVTQVVQPNGFSDGLDVNGAGNVLAGSAGRSSPEAIVVGPLDPGQTLSGRNFGEIPTAGLSGIVFLDPNGNASRDSGENSGLAGAIIRLTGTNDLGQAVDCSVTTGATGLYSFPDAADADPDCRLLRPGTYVLTETPPPGLEHSGAFIGSAGGTAGGVSGANMPAPGQANTVVSGIVIAGGAVATNYDFGATGQGLSGSVYVDRNGNGTRDADETGIPGVAIILSGSTSSGQDVCALIVCTVTTDAAGNYIFANVPGSSGAGYTLTEQDQVTPPLSDYGDGADAAGEINGAVRGNAANDEITGIVIGTGELGTSYLFGERASSLSGAAYVDANDDGVRQSGESPLSGITVTLSGTTASGQDICAQRAALDPVLGCTTTTGADGGYRFDDLPEGDYALLESQPSAYADGRESPGTPGGAVNNASFGSDPAQNRIAGIALGDATAGLGYDFGERAITLFGRVYKDPQRDGADAGGEPGIAGVTITLRQGGTVVATTTTGPDGSYRFENLPAGSYTVEETQPAGYGSSTPDSQAVNVSAGASQSIDFGDTVSSLAGSVFLDSNDDGIPQPGERGLTGVAVRLTGTDAAGRLVDVAATTAADGSYHFEDLLAGTYVVSETQPADYSDGKDAAGTAGGTVGNDGISAISLPAGIDASGYVFGELGQRQGGTVYVDSNLNGVQDPGETGIPNVVVELQKPDGTVLQTVTTGPDGRYDFSDITAGDYVVVEQQPRGYGDADENRANRAPLTIGVGSPPRPVNFGERVGSLAGLVFNDNNGNGLRDADEPGIPGVEVTISGTDARGNAVTLATVSGPDGSYKFIGLPGGTYNVVETQPADYTDGIDTPGSAGGSTAGDTISGVVLGAAQDAIGYLFSERGAGARISGRVWLDSDHDRAFDPSEPVYADWIAELRLGSSLIDTTVTGLDGGYAFTGVAPGAGYEVLFRNPANNAVYGSARPNETGASVSEGVVSPGNPAGARTQGGTLTELKLTPGADVPQQSLPLDPSGVVYDSVRRVAVQGAAVRITGPAGFDPALHLLGGTANVAQIVGADGMYQYLLLPGAPAGVYSLAVTPPDGSYNPVQPSSIVPPCAGPLDVGPTPDPMLVSAYDGPPPVSALQACSLGGQTTAYYLSFTLTPGASANVVNNNIPIDPVLEGAIIVTKTTPMVNANRGGLVPYTITARNTLAGAITGITVTDRMPAGFRYRAGSATIDGMPVEPQQAGRLLSWPTQSFSAGEEKTIQLVLTVGAGVGEGEHVNQAFAVNAVVDTVVSNIADATVRITPDPDFDCTDILGKAFDDRNMNGTQDEGEPGLPGVRLATVNGLLVTTDAEGRYHITCPMIPNEDRGSNFILKLDVRTLPSGYRMTTGNPETVRLTRGKFVKLNFGAALGRVVRVDLNADAFREDQLAPAFLEEVEGLVATLAEEPSILRIAYGSAGEEPTLVRRRIAAVRRAVEERWRERRGGYRLIIEEESSVRAHAAKGDLK